ncbi:hypothetical protein SCUCBS95973_009415 [Sporothrix curviconia]|uniref:Oxidoreductase n=1 Tax=Sporothrix curviconia TaxID=1260050 RepID=A0ABP0CXI3_9PEZI
MSPPPVRVAIIGLSKAATTSWASDAHLPYLLIDAGRERFQIVALCNSSVFKAEAAIEAYNLDPTTKAYGSPDDLAADPDVDLVICSTRVDTHYAAVLPSLEAGKDIYIEWPIASNMQDIQRLVETARKSGSGTLVGVQRRFAPSVLKIKEMVDDGAIGKLLNVNVTAHSGALGSGVWPRGLKYFAERSVGGNLITILVGHLMDVVESTVGTYIPGTVHAHTQLQSPNVAIMDPSTGNIVETIRSNVPDLMSLHGFVQSARTNHEPVSLTLHYQQGFPFPGTPALDWILTGTKGKIRLVDATGVSFYGGPGPDGVNIQLWKLGDETAETVNWAYSELQLEVPPTARAMQTLLYSYADAKRGVGKDDVKNSSDWPDLKSGAARALEVEEWLSSFKG